MQPAMTRGMIGDSSFGQQCLSITQIDDRIDDRINRPDPGPRGLRQVNCADLTRGRPGRLVTGG